MSKTSGSREVGVMSSATMTQPAASGDPGAGLARTTPRVLLVSTYDLGHQPFGLASPAAWLGGRGAEVACLDLAVQNLHEDAVRAADLIAFYLPMHTATRIAVTVIPHVRRLNPTAHLCAYGLYAPVNAELLRDLGLSSIIGGEFEAPLSALVESLREGRPRPAGAVTSLERQAFQVPDRRALPELSQYAYLTLPDGRRRTVGYTEATRGCKHLCRHCPIVPVYGGRFRVVQREVVLADIRQQVAAGAQHVTFGDPDFLNGPRHALDIVAAVHAEFPELTYDVTIKVEHLVRHLEQLITLRDTGCLLITSAVESLDQRILDVFDKRHSHADFMTVVTALREVGIALNPTFVAFTPWTTLEGYQAFLSETERLGLVENVTPIQYAIRLLIPAGSRLLELPETREVISEFDRQSLSYPWTHPDPRVDELQREAVALAAAAVAADLPRPDVFEQVWRLACDHTGHRPVRDRPVHLSTPVPRLSEPWYCCAEPTESQLAPPV